MQPLFQHPVELPPVSPLVSLAELSLKRVRLQNSLFDPFLSLLMMEVHAVC